VAQRVDRAAERDRRRLDERLMMAVPPLYGLLRRLFTRLDPGGRPRRWILREQVISGWAAVNRRDYELMETRYSRDLVYEFSPELVTLGLPDRVESRGQWRRAIADWVAAWDQVRHQPEFILDLGDRLLCLGRASARGHTSGAEIEFEYCQLIELAGGIVERERDFTKSEEALGAAGLEEDLLGQLAALPPGGVLMIG
jgi:ketosteroid isomerase-like protein